MSTQPDLHVVLEQTLGYQLIGTFIATAIYGITVLQTYIYYTRFHKTDSWRLQTLVIVLWALDTVCSALVCHALYIVLVRDWGVVASLADVPATFALENGFTCLVTAIVQCFFAHRVWLVSGRQSVFISIFITLLALLGFGGGLALTARIFITNLQVQAVEFDPFINHACIVDQTAAALCDVSITASLYYYLNKRRNDKMMLTRADSVLQSLVLYFISRGIVTMVFQILAVGTFAGLDTQQVWMLWHLTLSKVYVNSLLAILNARQYLRQTLDGPNNIHTISELQFNHTRSTGTGIGTDTSDITSSPGLGKSISQIKGVMFVKPPKVEVSEA